MYIYKLIEIKPKLMCSGCGMVKTDDAIQGYKIQTAEHTERVQKIANIQEDPDEKNSTVYNIFPLYLAASTSTDITTALCTTGQENSALGASGGRGWVLRQQ